MTTAGPALPSFREAGSGPGIVCVHANASTSGQWRGLMELLSPSYYVVAPDLYDIGKSPQWPSPDVITLSDEADLIEPVIRKAGEPVVLIGHSYGAAVAMIAALRNPGRVRAVAVYEPTLFNLIEADGPAPNDADGISNAVHAAGQALDAGSTDGAAEAFIDFWMGTGAWKNTPDARKPAIAASMVHVRRWKHALTTEPALLSAFRAFNVPVLYMTGKRSPQSALGVARRLIPALPRVEAMEFDKCGHMGPLTHPDIVNQAIKGFLERVAPGQA